MPVNRFRDRLATWVGYGYSVTHTNARPVGMVIVRPAMPLAIFGTRKDILQFRGVIENVCGQKFSRRMVPSARAVVKQSSISLHSIMSRVAAISILVEMAAVWAEKNFGWLLSAKDFRARINFCVITATAHEAMLASATKE